MNIHTVGDKKLNSNLKSREFDRQAIDVVNKKACSIYFWR